MSLLMITMMLLYVSMGMYLCFLETQIPIISIISGALLMSIWISSSHLPLMFWSRDGLLVLSLNPWCHFKILLKESLQLPERVILDRMEVLVVEALDRNQAELTSLSRKTKTSKLLEVKTMVTHQYRCIKACWALKIWKMNQI
jgi:hypothetical protein